MRRAGGRGQRAAREAREAAAQRAMQLPASGGRQATLPMGQPQQAPGMDQLLVSEQNRPLFAQLRALAGGAEGSGGLYRIRALPGSGLSTLLRAACGLAPARLRPLLLDGKGRGGSGGQLPGPPEWFRDCRFICIDGAELLAPPWHALLEGWLQAAQDGQIVLVAGTAADDDLQALPWQHRAMLQQAPAWALHWMPDELHQQMILGWARREGVRPAVPLARALVARGPRDAAGLRATWLDLLRRAEREGRRPDRVALMQAVRRQAAMRAARR